MNWRRGLFRLWIVGTALFVLAVAFIGYSNVKEKFAGLASTTHVLKVNEPAIGLLCADAQGVADVDYLRTGDNCWYAMSAFQRLYPEYSGLSENEIRKLRGVHGIAVADNPWVTLGVWASIAFGIPLVVLILGASLVWAFSGFAAKRP
jgi:hypothetical protein